ncbi:MAG: arylesterase [Methylocapsa sp.]|nr:arylesterase [Methylocapsa sp.]
MPQLEPVLAPKRCGLLKAAAIALLAASLGLAAGSSSEPSPVIKLIAFGDSLTAGFGLPSGDAFPAVLEKTLRNEGYNVIITNAGVSAETASGGLARLDWTIGDGADGAILELGGNDMLRGVNPEVTEAALDAIMAKFHARGIKVLIAGMRATQNFGREYKARFDAIYPELAKKYASPLYPFFLEGVAQDPALKQKDGIHPNKAGVARIVENILPTVRAFLDEIGVRATSQQPSSR